MLNENYALVADIGGTNARFCLVDLRDLTIDKVEVFACADFPGLNEAWTYYQSKQGLTTIKKAAIAIACPVTDDLVTMTNLHWQFSIQALKQQLGLEELQVLNDFTATAMSLPTLSANEKIQIGRGQIDLKKTMVVLGAGTGLGVAHLIPTGAAYIPLPGEAGHSDWAAQTEQEWFIQRYLEKSYGRVSVERIISGPGLENLYLAIAAYQKKVATKLSAAEIARLALTGQSTLALTAVNQFLASLGSFAGDLALSLSTFGGVYIAGGIVPKLLPLIPVSEFRARFENKGRFSSFNNQIATCIVTANQPGLLGAAVYLRQCLGKEHYNVC